MLVQRTGRGAHLHYSSRPSRSSAFLSPTPEQLLKKDIAYALVAAIRRGDEDDDPAVKMCVRPKATSVILVCQILADDDGADSNAPPVPRAALLSERFIRRVVTSLEADQIEERRLAAERVLRAINDGGSFSMMHTFVVHLQSTPPEHSPAVANLLQQLDLFVSHHIRCLMFLMTLVFFQFFSSRTL
ncbi:unnamed protein product [Urochloa humidicola]